MEQREGFVFYRSFYEALEELPADTFKAVLSALARYALDGVEPELSGFEKAAFLLMKPQIDANNQRRENGAKGGRPITGQKPNVTEPKPKKTKANQTITKANQTKPSTNQTEPKEKDKVKDKEKVKVKDISDTVMYTAGEPESADASSAAPEPADCEAIPLNDGSEWTPTREQFEEFERLYPALDVRQKFRDMRAWSLANPSNRKTRTGVLRFVTAWLTREQNRAPTKAKPEKRTRFDNFESHGTDYDAIMWAGVAKANGAE